MGNSSVFCFFFALFDVFFAEIIYTNDKQCTLKAEEPKVSSKFSATPALHIVPPLERFLRVFTLSQ